MTRVVAVLRALLPKSLRDVVCADLEREFHMRLAGNEGRWADHLWFVWEATKVLARVWVARLLDQIANAPRRLTTEAWHSARALARSPGVTVTAIIVIALGVAAPTATYSVGDALTRGLPVPDAEELVTVSHESGRWQTVRRGLSPAELRLLEGSGIALGPIAAYESVVWDVGGGGTTPERIGGARITPNLLEVLRESPVLGRDFSPDDAGRAVALIGERYWRARYGGDETLLRRSVRLNGIHHRVVGVLPSHLLFPGGAQIWVPFSPQHLGQDSSSRRLGTLARLPQANALARIQEEVRGVAVMSSRSELNARLVANRLLRRLNIDSASRKWFLGMLAIVTCLLLVAVFNVTNLLLCRAVSRQRDVAIRTALGASRTQVAVIHLTEAAIVSVIGGALGVGLALRAVDLFRWAATGRVGCWVDLRADLGMLGFALGLVLFSALLAGSVPAIQAMRRDVRGLSGWPGRGGAFKLAWMSDRLVVLQVMFSVGLLVQAVTIVSIAFSDPDLWSGVGSFEADEVLVASYAFRAGERPEPAERSEFHRSFVERVAERGGIRGAAIMAPAPGQAGPEDWVVPADYPSLRRYDRNGTQIVRMSPGALDVLGAPVIRGRDLNWADGADAATAVLVNEAYARRFFPDSDPVGEAVRFIPPGRQDPVTAVVVGVVPPLVGPRIAGGSRGAIYVPISVGRLAEANILVRAAQGRDPTTHLGDLRSAMDAIDPDKPLFSAETLRSRIRREMAMILMFAGLFVFAGLAGIFMSGTGLFTVMAFAVGRRTREIGVRTALGASRPRVLAAVLGRAAVHLAQGTLLGLIFAFAMADRFMFVERDARVVVGVTVGLILTGLFAATVPAVRAIRVEPTVALAAD